jgi:hypothetical protein
LAKNSETLISFCIFAIDSAVARPVERFPGLALPFVFDASAAGGDVSGGAGRSGSASLTDLGGAVLDVSGDFSDGRSFFTGLEVFLSGRSESADPPNSDSCSVSGRFSGVIGAIPGQASLKHQSPV